MKILRIIYELIQILWRYAGSYKLRIQPNKLVFMTYQNQYTCNPKYITEYLLKSDLNIEIVWIVDRETLQSPKTQNIPSNVRLVARNSQQSFYELMSAGIWIDNALNCMWRILPKRKTQLYLNTWHGSLGIKRLDTYNPGKGYWRYIARRSNRAINYFLSNSQFEDSVFKYSYWPNVKCIHTGHARNDIFFNHEYMYILRKRILSFYNLSEDTRLLLYAPTFREDKTCDFLTLDFEKLLKSVTQKFPGKWKILFRFHFHNRHNTIQGMLHHNMIDASAYPDMQELLAGADMGITDYSSWIYDYMLTMRPAFIYAPDLKKYNTQRGFYYPLESTPFFIAQNTEELTRNISLFSPAVYENKVKKFLSEKGCIEDGMACKRIETIILDYLTQYKNNA